MQSQGLDQHLGHEEGEREITEDWAYYMLD